MRTIEDIEKLGHTILAHAKGTDWSVALVMDDDPRSDLSFVVVQDTANMSETSYHALHTTARERFERLIEDHVRRRIALLNGRAAESYAVTYRDGYFSVDEARAA